VQRSRRRSRVRHAFWLLFAMLPGLVVLSSASAVGPDPSVVGEWTTPFEIGVVGIHSVLLPSGKVLLFEKPSGAVGVGSSAVVWDPVTGFQSGPPPSATWDNANVPDPLDLFCAAQSMTSEGRLIVVGGHKYGAVNEVGTPETTLFNTGSSRWARGPVLREPRWYATTIELGNGRILIFSGLSTAGNYIAPVDSYNPASNALKRLPFSANETMALYPRMFVLPNGKLIRVGPDVQTKLFDPATATWSTLTNIDGSFRSGEMAVLLPGLKKILVAGGDQPSLATARILDTSEATPTWRATGSMAFGRRWGNAVMLADGTVLAVGGGAEATYVGPVFASELFDPVTETWTTMASQTASRMYHSTAILLPDGRVLSAGQTNGTLQTTAEIYSPPYLFHGARPTISSAPPSVEYGAGFQISTPNAADIARVALVRPGSVTHSMHFDQRYVDLQYTKGSGVLNATAPANGNEAPPGWYMLFVLNSTGVPSVASWVHVAGKTLDVPVAVGSDDAEEKVATGATSAASTDLQLTTAGTNRQVVGMRFANVAIPSGAVITKAYVQFEVDEASTGAASLRVRGQAADDPPTFANVVGNISSRVRTLASVAWNPRSWPTVQVHGPNQRTPDLSAIVQELVNRPGWASGNAMVLIVTGTGRRTAESANGTYAPILHLEFQAT
jgi:galactose oxidase